MYETNCLFCSGDLSDWLREREDTLKRAAQTTISNAELRSEGVDAIADRLAAEVRLESIVLQEDNQTASHEPADIDISGRRDFYVGAGENPLRAGVQYTIHIPFSGTTELLRLRPNTFSTTVPYAEVDLRRGTIDIVIGVPQGADAKYEISERLTRELRQLRNYIQWQRGQINNFNSRVRKAVVDVLQARLSDLRQGEDALQSLGIRLEQGLDSPQLPILLEQKIDLEEAQTLAAPSGAGKIERKISDRDYDDILSIIRHQCRTFEGAPASFRKLGEEQLRDVVRASLNAIYRIAGAEAFRTQGKTDICIEANQSRSAFVTECKIWRGGQGLSQAIDQLLGYLTWRDSKTAIVVFNKQVKKFASLLERLPGRAAQHGAFLRQLEDTGIDGEWDFLLSHYDGHDVECRLMLFNLYSDS